MPTPFIRSKDNAQIKAARRLLQAPERRAQGQLLVEGARLIEDAWESGIRPAVCFYEPTTLTATSPGYGLVRTFEDAGIECLACSPGAFGALAETVTPQGIAALFPLPAIAMPALLDFVLILDRVRDPGNAGTLLRTAEAAGVQAALFGSGSVDAFSPKVVRAAMGTHFRLPIRECANWNEISALVPATLPLYVATMDGTLLYDAVDWNAPAGLIVGGEAAGASTDAMAAAQSISIPMQGRTESLNAAMAGAIILFEAARQRRRAGHDALPGSNS